MKPDPSPDGLLNLQEPVPVGSVWGADPLTERDLAQGTCVCAPQGKGDMEHIRLLILLAVTGTESLPPLLTTLLPFLRVCGKWVGGER